ncbi:MULTISPECIES: 3-mercaptopyruvate sulfurtransferase [unclassified Sphingomonas]|jgi:thiosulfate/3-mercaptopyruvate sulfurtransferase|uniref:3-mercaptopyruvate sulfurtransferase n=1 Tax=unclassified Sphingomonas TaxID=196159 RepID=UPI000E10D581|nr:MULTISPECIES: 3-mercaptopyruvate sulfurtransferase [unclassified Sphingomonas]AXJ95755.1 3-mercaptopyruvate sulfurtransferase [Sphingomonas sp. FARSPH]
MDALVTTAWLAQEMGASDLRIVDATYFANFPGEAPRDAAAEYEAAHIPGAVFMNLGELRDTDSDLPMMLPSAEKFASRMQSLGLGDGSRIVLYDNSPHHTAARAWWMLRTFGAHDVAILDGGFAKWQAEGRETASGRETSRHRHFTVWVDTKTVRTLDQMKANVDSRAEQVIDARSAARFTGEEPDPRPATHAGHIPGSKNLPQGQLFNADGTWKTGDALRRAFADAGVDLDRPMVATCGSGITAAVLAFGAHLVGKDMPIYDGSWSEWGADRSTPKAMGAKEAVDA